MKINLNAVSPSKIIIGFVLVLVLNCGAAQAQPQQGLMSRLIEIKYSTELYLTTQIKNKTNPAKKDSAFALYNTMRWKVDGFVYQLSSTLITKNSPKAFKELDAWCYAQKESIINIANNRNIAAHVESFADIDALYQTQIVPKLYNNPKSLNLTTNVFYLLKDSYSIIKGLSDLKTRKTMAIVELLDHARLLGPGEIGKGGKYPIISVDHTNYRVFY
jgi:hypothetical protein